MIRKAIIKETERRGWTMERLWKESGVKSYSSIQRFFNGKGMGDKNCSKLMDVLKLEISKAR